MNASKRTIYSLDIRIPDAPPQRVSIRSKLTLGASPDRDLVLKGRGLSPHHAIFRLHNDVLSLHNLAANSQLDANPLQPGRQYVIDKGDKITLGEVEILIRKDEVDDDDDSQWDDPKTSIKSIMAFKQEMENEALENQPSQGFMAKLKGLLRRKKDELGESDLPQRPRSKLTTSRAKHYSKPPGILTRAMGTLAVLALAYALVFVLFPIVEIDINGLFYGLFHKPLEGAATTPELTMLPPEVASLLFKIRDIFHAQLEKVLNGDKEKIQLYLEILYTWMPTYFVFCCLQVSLSFLLGTELSNFLVGCEETQNNFFVKRVKALIRALIGSFTTILLIFDVPALIGKRTLKEVLTFSHLEVEGRFRKLLGVFLICPSLIIIAPLSPLFRDKDFFELSWYRERPQVKMRKQDFYRPISLTNFNNETFNLPIEEGVFFLPVISPRSSNKDYFIMIEPEKEGLVKISPYQFPPLPWKEFKLNPLMPFLMPNVEQKASTKLRAFEHAIRLTPDYLPKILTEAGPFVIGLVNFRKDLKQIFGLNENSEISMITLSNRTLILVSPGQANSEMKHNYVFPIDSNMGLVLESSNGKGSLGLTSILINRILPRLGKSNKVSNEKSSPLILLALLEQIETASSVDKDVKKQLLNEVAILKKLFSNNNNLKPKSMESYFIDLKSALRARLKAISDKNSTDKELKDLLRSLERV